MIIRINQTAGVPLYMQIRDQLVEAIARGELRPGDGLPSVRRLANDLGINLHTVNKAYAVLRDEGYLVMRGRSGAFVADGESALRTQSFILPMICGNSRSSTKRGEAGRPRS